MRRSLPDSPTGHQAPQSLDRLYSRVVAKRLRRFGASALVVVGLSLASLGLGVSAPAVTQVSARAFSSAQVADGSTPSIPCPSVTLPCA